MPVRISELVRNKRWVTIHIDDQELRVAYRPNAISMEMLPTLDKLQDSDGNTTDSLNELADLMVEFIADWDLVDDEDRKLSVTRQTFLKLPYNLTMLIMAGVQEDISERASEKKALSATSGAGLPAVDSSALAQNGIPSSERANTWA
jgi:hypothetical protein